MAALLAEVVLDWDYRVGSDPVPPSYALFFEWLIPYPGTMDRIRVRTLYWPAELTDEILAELRRAGASELCS